MRLYRSFAENKHKFKFIVVALAINLRNWISLAENHGVVKIKADVFEIQRLSETCSRLVSFNGGVGHHPNDYAAEFGHSIQFFDYVFKRKIKAFVVSQIIIRRRGNR